MTTIIRATVPADKFSLEQTFKRIPSAEFEIEQVVADRRNQFIPLLWATADGSEALKSLPRVMENDPSTNSVDVVAEFDNEYLLKMGGRVNNHVIFPALMEPEAAILDCCGKNGTWYFCILFPERDSVSSMYETCQEYDIDVHLTQISPLEDSFWQGRYGLTKNQYETILGAYKAGYYQVPRKINLEELSSHFDVSHQAISERLRRGHANLIAHTMRREATPDALAD